ncbi:hypothetical protein [Planctomicrobium sp. SH527]|uniref:hypothetical protein n=1 Tax=Planctomicrobium sp. SH527 TaxID=3448123 RepID=UPI003F5B62DC
MRVIKTWTAFSLVAASGMFLWGCSGNNPTAPVESTSQQETSSPTQPTDVTSSLLPSPPKESEGEHGHKPGAHGGIMVSLGRDSYHAEAVFEQGGRLRLYTLGQDETRVIDVESQKLKGFVKAEGESTAHPFTMDAEPQEGDAQGRASQFVGTLPNELQGRNLEVTIPNIVISGERFRIGFKSKLEQHGEEMPSKLVEEEERQLYLTPGGNYTEADIAANGGVTASVKFRGLKSEHDMFPKPGDKICPITETKANSAFSWVVGGNRYEFCCPPCVDEFLKEAKSGGSKLKLPEEYVKR